MSLTPKAKRILDSIVQKLKKELNLEDDQSNLDIEFHISEQNERSCNPHSMLSVNNHIFLYIRYDLFQDDQVRITEFPQTSSEPFSVEISLDTANIKLKVFTEEQLDQVILALTEHIKRQLHPIKKKIKKTQTDNTIKQWL
jgi:hypothetical protein